MPALSLAEFADKTMEIMPVIAKEFFRNPPSRFYKSKITMPQFIVLDMLYRIGGSNMTDLARHIFVTTAAMTGIVDRLVRDGYIRRASDPDDRRVIRAILTPKGAGVVREMTEKRKRMTMKIFGMISRKDRSEYLRILEIIRGHLRKEEDQESRA